MKPVFINEAKTASSKPLPSPLEEGSGVRSFKSLTIPRLPNLRRDIHKRIPFLALGMSVFGIVLLSCDRDKNNPGYDYFPDMAYSRAYETYSSNPNFTDGKTLQAPVDGTISREAEYYPYKKTDADLIKAAKLKNSLKTDFLNLTRGEKVYKTICLQCHGDKGDGKGYLFVSGRFTYAPANLISTKTKNRTDGELYHIITVGLGLMPAHGIIVRPDDRWKVIMYIRDLQGKQP